ncbi:MAG: HAMP domain-containing histidine kinase [Deltaproteobacteria bacterium]|nr:HAMP domain-containing histidine kinase [Deltaproteobacteria bacterium]
MKTIRAKVTVFFALCLIIIGAVTAVYYKNIFSLREKLIEVENLDDFFNNVLELRRYEKNFIYYRDLESLKESEFYLLKIEGASKELISHIEAGASEGDYRKFQQNLASYKAILDENKTLIDTGITDVQLRKIREKGKALVYFSQKLIEAKRQRIQAALQRTLTVIPLAFLGILVIFIVVMFHLLSRGILKPLSLIEEATRQVAKETFTPIAYQTEREDEISHLIQAFNNMARELEVRQEQLLHSRKLASIGTFTSGIAHELNNPLNNISLTAEALQLGYETMSKEEIRGLIDDILTQADRAGQVVKNLLDFSRSERPVLKRLQIKDVIEETLKLVKNQLLLADIQLKLDISDDLPPINGRGQDLQHVFLNMFLNSIDATGPSGTISIKAHPVSGGFIRIDVTDTGTGIKPGDVEHIFDPFFTTKEVGDGTGLGLSLAYGIIRSHGGHIEVRSELDKGTTFSIFLPAADQDQMGTHEDKNSRH